MRWERTGEIDVVGERMERGKLMWWGQKNGTGEIDAVGKDGTGKIMRWGRRIERGK